MTRKLVALNLLLLAIAGALAWRIRKGWLEARERERALLEQPLRPVPAPPVSPLPPPPPVSPMNYVEVAQKFLFSKDRNPTVEVIVTPPKPMPPLPLIKGVLLFGEPPTVIMSEKAGAPERSYRPGDAIGEFKLISVNDREIEFEWEGKKVKRSLQEALAEAKKVSVAAATSTPAESSAAPPPAAPAAQPLATPLATAKSGPGADVGGSVRACNPGDTSPAGAVVDGYRKVLSETPFGKRCYWEPVR